MTEVCRLTAQQRLQRLDSFLVETTINKMEKVAYKTPLPFRIESARLCWQLFLFMFFQDVDRSKDELKWEVEQLKTQNVQLKKDNRELRQTCAKLEQRIDGIERKFKTMARMLQ